MAKSKTEAPRQTAQSTMSSQDTATPERGDGNSVEMRIPARAEWVRVVRLATAGVAARLGFSYDEIEDLKLAVAEACNNAILHGSAALQQPGSGEGQMLPLVTVRWTVLPDRLRISVSDQGRLELPGLQIPESGSEEKNSTALDDVSEELPEGGMGLLLIQSLMDEVEQESGPHADTTLHMVKYAPPARGAESKTSGRRASAHVQSRSTSPSTEAEAADSSDMGRHELRSTKIGPTPIEY